MTDAASSVALTTLRYWTERAQGRDGSAVLPDETTAALVRRTAMLLSPSVEWDVATPLQSIFSCIKMADAPNQPPAYLPRAPLHINRNTLFPTTMKPGDTYA